MIKVRLIKEDKIHSALIRWYSWSNWNHVDFALPDGAFLGARVSGGVQIRPHNYTKVVEELYLGIELGSDLESQIMSWAHAQIGKPYDMKSIVNFAFRCDDDGNDNKFYCSEFICRAFQLFNHPILRLKYADRCPPEYIAMSMLLQETTAWSS